MVENRVNFKLRYMLASTDSEFQQRVSAAVERRQQFEVGSDDFETDNELTYNHPELADLLKNGKDCMAFDPSDDEAMAHVWDRGQ